MTAAKWADKELVESELAEEGIAFIS